MFGKLIKYEWRGAARSCLPIYGAVLLMAVINRIFMQMNSPSAGSGFVTALPQGIAAMLYGGLIFASFTVTFVILVQRFYKNLLGDEGYLMFTLPISVGKHIWAKTIVSTLMSILCGITVILSALIIGMSAREWLQIPKLFTQLSGNELLGCIEILIFLILGTACSALSVYLCIAIGHQAKRHRIAAAIAAGFGLNVIMQILLWVFLRFSTLDMLNAWLNSMPDEIVGHVVFLLLNLIVVAIGAVFFFGTRYLLTYKLNLE